MDKKQIVNDYWKLKNIVFSKLYDKHYASSEILNISVFNRGIDISYKVNESYYDATLPNDIFNMSSSDASDILNKYNELIQELQDRLNAGNLKHQTREYVHNVDVKHTLQEIFVARINYNLTYDIEVTL